VTAATCISAAFGSFMMGIVARYPIALAPGMGLNAYFTYTVVKGMGVPWQAALGAVFISGVAFVLLTALGIRQLIVAAIPFELYAAVAAGVGLFIAFIGFRNAGLDRAASRHPGDLRQPARSAYAVGRVRSAGDFRAARQARARGHAARDPAHDRGGNRRRPGRVEAAELQLPRTFPRPR
jgi:AGZA family xanthine/uracil permease-like MFS transporter